MTNINVMNFEKHTAEYLNQAVLFNDVINVNTQNGNVVILSEEDYLSILETLHLQSYPSAAQEILLAMKEPKENYEAYDPSEEW